MAVLWIKILKTTVIVIKSSGVFSQWEFWYSKGAVALNESSLRDLKIQPHSQKRTVLWLELAGNQLFYFCFCKKRNRSVCRLHESVANCLLPGCMNSERKGTLHGLYFTYRMPLCMMLDLSEHCVGLKRWAEKHKGDKSVNFCNIQKYTTCWYLSCVAETERIFWLLAMLAWEHSYLEVAVSGQTRIRWPFGLLMGAILTFILIFDWRA